MNSLWWNALNDSTSTSAPSSPPPKSRPIQSTLDSSPVPHSKWGQKRARTSALEPETRQTSKYKSGTKAVAAKSVPVEETVAATELVRNLYGSAQALRKEALRVMTEFDGRCARFQDVVEKWVRRDAELKEEGLRGQEDLMAVIKNFIETASQTLASFAATASTVDARLDGVAALLEGVYRTQLEQQEVLRQVIEGQAELLRRRSSGLTPFSSAESQAEFICIEHTKKKNDQVSFETTGFDEERCSHKNPRSPANQENNDAIGNDIKTSNTVLDDSTGSLIVPVSETAITYQLRDSAEPDDYKHNVDNSQNQHDSVHTGDYRDGEKEFYNNTESTLINSDFAYTLPRPHPCYARSSSHGDSNSTDHDQPGTQTPPPRERNFKRLLVSSDDHNPDSDDICYEKGYSSDKDGGQLNLREL